MTPWVLYVGLAISMASAATWPRPWWIGVILGLVVIGVGIVMRRLGGAVAEEIHGSGAATEGSRLSTMETVQQVKTGIEALLASLQELDEEAIKKRIETLQQDGPERVGASQESLAARFGFARYAEVMSPLAIAERLLHRAWSAAADGHRPECERSLREALPHAEEAATLAAQLLAP